MIDVIWGTTKDKPESSKLLADSLSKLTNLSGYLYIGYPIIGTPTGPIKFDALLASKEVGLVGFDLVEGTEIDDYHSRQDQIASMLDVKLKPYANLKHGRELKFEINVVTFAPAKVNLPTSEAPYFIANEKLIAETLANFEWTQDTNTFSQLVAAIQVVTSIRGGKQKRTPQNENSRGARLKALEDSIANLDQHQSQAVIETVEGVQRIRGLAGSGKTIILALKVAYLHSQNEDWKIAVTFNTRSLKEQFKRLITNFSIEQAGTEPDWEKIDILNAWGGPGDKERDGIYHKFCRLHQIPFLDFKTARAKFGDDKEFEGACAEALLKVEESSTLYDIILIDEAQDFPPDFLRLCYKFLKDPKRLVYAYDELQSLNENSVLPPEELFGLDGDGKPLVRLNLEDELGPRQDIILEKCYRNSRPVLATAHALGFGIYREQGLVQFFEQDSLWSDVGYTVAEGELKAGSTVTLTRTSETSPLLLENHSPIEDLIQFIRFDHSLEQSVTLAILL
jgi:superfamily I DNA and RNA helicase